MAGIGLSTAYLVPWSMLPDVIELDELQTGQRREGLVCGLMVQLQKLGTTLSIFMVGKVLDWSGYINSGIVYEEGLVQPASALAAIRRLLGPLPALVLLKGIGFAVKYPITQEMHASLLFKLGNLRKKYFLSDG